MESCSILTMLICASKRDEKEQKYRGQGPIRWQESAILRFVGGTATAAPKPSFAVLALYAGWPSPNTDGRIQGVMQGLILYPAFCQFFVLHTPMEVLVLYCIQVCYF